MEDTIKLRYSASSNITFRGEIDTGISREEWGEMSEEEQAEVIQDVAAELVDIWPVEE